jgi:hypothetical protein
MKFHLVRRLFTSLLVFLSATALFSEEHEQAGTLRWRVIGPLENYSGSAFASKLPAERPFDTLTHKNARGGIITWREWSSTPTSGLPFFNYSPERTGAYIANTFVESNDRQRVTLRAMIAGSIEIYVNDSLAFGTTSDILTFGTIPVSVVTLEKGWNRIMIKAGNAELPFCMVVLSVVDASGKVLTDFASASEPRLYPKQTLRPEPLSIPDSLYDMGYEWNDAFTDSLLRSIDAEGATVGAQMQRAVEKKQQGLLSAAAQILSDVVYGFPERYDAWFLKGSVHHEMMQRDSAIYCLEQGLVRDPGAYGPISLLRYLRNQPDMFSYFKALDVDSIRNDTTTRKRVFQPDFEIILHDEKAIVLSGGSSVVETDQLFRLTDEIGVALHSRYPAENSLNAVSLSVTGYKRYGDSISCELDGGYYEFDELEPGDYVRIRRRYIERDTLVIPQYYHHRHEFQRRMYTHRSRYQIIMPKGDKYQWRTYFTLAEPEYTESPLGYLLSWDDRDLKPLDVREEDMPRRDITGTIETSTIPSWEYLAQRYNEAFVRCVPQLGNDGTANTDLVQLMDDIAPVKDSLDKTEVIQRARVFLMNLNASEQSQAYPHCRSINDIMENGPRSNVDLVTMFVAMLSLRNITAYPMLVDTTTTPFHASPTPSLPFNHMIAVVPGDSLPAFYDLSQRPMQSMYSLDDNVRGAFGLVVRKGLREPMYVASHPIMTRFADEEFRMNPVNDTQALVYQSRLSTNLDSSVVRHEVEMVAGLRQSQPSMNMNPNDVPLQDSVWYEQPRGSHLLRFCRVGPNRSLMLRDTADSTRIRLWMPWTTDVMYPSTPYDTSMRTTPLLRRYKYDSTVTTVVIHAPDGFTFDKKLPRGLFNVESIRYSLISIQQGDSLTVIRKVVNTQPYVSPEGFYSFQSTHEAIIALDQQPVFLVPKKKSAPKRRTTK